MIVLTTGTSGYIGRNSFLSKSLDFRNFEVGLKALPKKEKITVIHLAGIVGEKKVSQNPTLSRKINIELTERLASLLYEFESSRLLYVSTSHVYKKGIERKREDSILEPKGMYANQKLIAENILKSIFYWDYERLLITRIFSVLGPGMPEGTLGWAAERASNEAPLRYGDDKRDFLSPRVIMSTLENLALRPWGVGVVNVCSGNATSINSAARSLRNYIGLETPPQCIRSEISDDPIRYGDNSLLQSHFNWHITQWNDW